MCGVYYDDEFEDCLKQVRAIYPNLDLFQIIIDDTIPATPEGDDTVSEENDDSIHTISQEVKDTDAEVAVQPASKGPKASMVPSAVDLMIADGRLLWTRLSLTFPCHDSFLLSCTLNSFFMS